MGGQDKVDQKGQSVTDGSGNIGGRQTEDWKCGDEDGRQSGGRRTPCGVSGRRNMMGLGGRDRDRGQEATGEAGN